MLHFTMQWDAISHIISFFWPNRQNIMHNNDYINISSNNNNHNKWRAEDEKSKNEVNMQKSHAIVCSIFAIFSIFFSDSFVPFCLFLIPLCNSHFIPFYWRLDACVLVTMSNTVTPVCIERIIDATERTMHTQHSTSRMKSGSRRNKKKIKQIPKREFNN